MSWLEIISIAYLLTGVSKVLRALSGPAANRPDYIRERNVLGFVAVILAWFPLDLIAYKQLGIQEDLRANGTVFFAFTAFGYIVRLN